MNVVFQKSDKKAVWDGSSESLLELGESLGINLDFGCRRGNCTACQQPKVSGDIEYLHEHNGVPEDGNILLCCSVPRSDVVIDA